MSRTTLRLDAWEASLSLLILLIITLCNTIRSCLLRILITSWIDAISGTGLLVLESVLSHRRLMVLRSIL